MPVVVHRAPRPEDWQLVIYTLADDGKTERLEYERTIDGVTETRVDDRYVAVDLARVFAHADIARADFDRVFPQGN